MCLSAMRCLHFNLVKLGHVLPACETSSLACLLHHDYSKPSLFSTVMCQNFTATHPYHNYNNKQKLRVEAHKTACVLRI